MLYICINVDIATVFRENRYKMQILLLLFFLLYRLLSLCLVSQDFISELLRTGDKGEFKSL